MSVGDTSGCEFHESVSWDDNGAASALTFGGGGDGATLAAFTHRYKKWGKYAIAITAQTTVGTCSSGDATLEFTFGSASAPTAACTQATALYQAEQKALDNLLDQLKAAQGRQTADQDRASELTREVDDDNALIARYQDLESASDDDAGIISNDIRSFTEETRDLPGPEDKLKNELKSITSRDLDPETEDIKSGAADASWGEAAAAEGEEVTAADEALEAVEVTRETAANRLFLVALAREASQIVTADIALKVVIVQLEDQQDAYRQANSKIRGLKTSLANAKDELALDNEEIDTLTGRVDTAQSAAQAALAVMTSACRTNSAVS